MLVDIKRDINHDKSVNLSQAKSIDNEKDPPDFGVERNVISLEPIIAVVVIACNRPDYIRQTLDNLLK